MSLVVSVNDEWWKWTVDILYVSNELVIASLPCTIRPIFSSFLTFCWCFTRLSAGTIKSAKYRNSENISHIVSEN